MKEQDHLVLILWIWNSANHLPAAIAKFGDIPTLKRSFFVRFKIVSHVFHLRMHQRVKQQASKQLGLPDRQDQKKQLFVAHGCFLPEGWHCSHCRALHFVRASFVAIALANFEQ